MSKSRKGNELLERATALRTLVDKARTLGPELSERLAELDADTSYTEEYKQGRRDSLRAQYAESVREIRAYAEETREAITAEVAAMHAAMPDGAEGLAARMEAADARQRVRGLVGQGRNPREIVAVARQHGDRLTLEAIRDEARWIDGLGEGFDGVIRRALIDVVGEDEAAALRAESVVIDDWPLMEHHLAIAETKLDKGPDLADAVQAKALEADRASLDIERAQLAPQPGQTDLEHAVAEEFATMAAHSAATDPTEVTA